MRARGLDRLLQGGRIEAGHAAPAKLLQRRQMDLGTAQERRVNAGNVLQQQGLWQHGQMSFDRQVGEPRSQRLGGGHQPGCAQTNAFRRAGAARGEGNFSGPGRQFDHCGRALHPDEAGPLTHGDKTQVERGDARWLISEQGIGAGLRQHMHHLRRAEKSRQRQMHRIGGQRRQVGHCPGRTVVGQDGNDATGGQPRRQNIDGFNYGRSVPGLCRTAQHHGIRCTRSQRGKQAFTTHAPSPFAEMGEEIPLGDAPTPFTETGEEI